MSKKSQPRRAASVRSGNVVKAGDSSPWPALGLLAALIATLTVAAITPTEQPVESGATLPLILLWLLLLVALSLASVRWPLGWRLDRVDIAVGAFVAWSALSGLVAVASDNARAAINGAWNYVALGLVFLIARQLVATPLHRRAVTASMISLSAALAAHGAYQFFYSQPRQERQYFSGDESQRRRMLHDAGVSPEPTEPARAQFESRLRSTEPFAGFALANSLAGVLAAWGAAACAVTCQYRPPRRRAVVVIAAGVVLICFCLVLTKSRSAWLGFATAILALSWILRGQRGWRAWLTSGLAVLGVLLVAGKWVGSLDWEVLSEAGKSLEFRWQYWQGALKIAASNPWFGCGPGNFQQAYALYKPPMASETVADPHGFVFEVAATLGIPALILLVFSGMCVVLAASAEARFANQAATSADTTRQSALLVATAGGFDAPPSPRLIELAMLVGLASGALLAAPLALVMQSPLEVLSDDVPTPVIWVLGTPVAALMWWGLRGWVRDGQWRPLVAASGGLAIMVNLLAAGGFSYLGVGQFVWLLAALLAPSPVRWLFQAASKSQASVATIDVATSADGSASLSATHRGLNASYAKTAAWMAVVGSVLLLVLFQQTALQPVLQASSEIARAEEGDLLHAIASYTRAAESDPWAAAPWRALMQLRHQQWSQGPSSVRWEAFENARRAAVQRDPRAYTLFREAGNLYLSAWRQSGQPDHLQAAIDDYRALVRLYPHYAMNHAQLAWALHLQGSQPEARQAAQTARDLDVLNPHAEHKLARRKLFDPGDSATVADSAEQRVLQLRNTQ